MKKIEERVRMLTEQYGCADPMRLCELMGITVLQLELPDSVKFFTAAQILSVSARTQASA